MFWRPFFVGAVLLGAARLPAQRCDGIAAVVRETVSPLLKEHQIPGMAVSLTVNGQPYFFNFGVASKASGAKVTENTIFEIGSVSKVFTATLLAYAESLGKLRLSDPASRHLKELAGSGFDRVNLLALATYTPGGLPLQFPDSVTNHQEMIAYYRGWRPEYPPGTFRRYSNPSIGLAGYIAAQSLGQPFPALMEKKLFPLLGLADSYIDVPPGPMDRYAFGYNAQGQPVRVSPGMLAAEAYGVKTTAKDLVGMLERISDPARIPDPALRKAIAATWRGYYRAGSMTQGLGWERYGWPGTLESLVEGNTPKMALEPNAAQAIVPPLPSSGAMLLNKTGSTNGFGAYVAFVPNRRIGLVMLANRSYPNPARAQAGYRILKALDACVR
jgi:beta-lactamase class C